MGVATGIAVTGGTGFVGRHVVGVAVAGGQPVRVLAREPEALEAFSWSREVETKRFDMEQPSAPSFEGCSHLAHLAWPGLPNYGEAFHLEENLPASLRLIEQAIDEGVETVLVTGTCFEYGMAHGPLAADHPLAPNTVYAEAKVKLHEQLLDLQQRKPFTLQWARLFYMHGEGQAEGSLLSLLKTAIDNGDAEFPMSGGEQLRDYLPVTEVADKLLQLLTSGADGSFNICSGEPISIRRLAEEFCANHNADIHLKLGHYPYPDHEPMAFWGVPSKLGHQVIP